MKRAVFTLLFAALGCGPSIKPVNEVTVAPTTDAAAPVVMPIAAPVSAPTTEGPTKSTTEDGLVIEDLTVGTGLSVSRGDTIKVEYEGRLEDGSVFDTSHGRAPFVVQIGKGQVIRGWELGLLGMKMGGRRRLTIPAPLGYGARGAPPKIPPNATLVFEIDLLDIKP